MQATVVLRKSLFYLFTAIFIVFCPLIVLYALGYFFKPGMVQGLVKTGLIYISTVPKEASVYFDQKQFSKKTPATLRDLLPGEYTLRILHQGFRPWEQTVPVVSGKATVLDKILLIPDSFKQETLAAEPFDNLAALDETDFLLLFKGKRIDQTFVYDRNRGHLSPLLEDSKVLPFDAKILSYETVRRSPYVLLHTESREGERFVWFKAGTKDFKIKDLTPLFVEKPEKVEWIAGEEDTLFTYQKGALNRLNLSSNSILPKLIDGVTGYGLFNRAIYWIKSQSAMFRSHWDGDVQITLLRDPEFFHSVFGTEDFFHIKVLARNQVLF